MFDERAPLSMEMDEVKEHLLACTEEFVELGDRILAIRSALPPERTHETQKMAAFCSRIQAEQEVLGELLERWRMILEEINGAENLSRNHVLLDLLLVYNMVNRRELAVNEYGALIRKTPVRGELLHGTRGSRRRVLSQRSRLCPCRIPEGSGQPGQIAEVSRLRNCFYRRTALGEGEQVQRLRGGEEVKEVRK